MADVHSKQQRSYNMAQIKSIDTKPEIFVRKYLFKNGFRYRKNLKKILLVAATHKNTLKKRKKPLKVAATN